MDVLALVGRVLFSLVFLGSAMGHFAQTEGMAGFAASKKVPAARLVVLGSGAYISLAALMIILGVLPEIGALAVTLFLLLTAFVMHNFWAERDASSRMQEQIHFMKDLALAGGGLVIFVLYAAYGAGLTLVDPVL